jgi:hypothetical protein
LVNSRGLSGARAGAGAGAGAGQLCCVSDVIHDIVYCVCLSPSILTLFGR